MVLQERQNHSTVDNAPNDGDGVSGGRRSLKRNKTFAAPNGRQLGQQQTPRRHGRGPKGRYTVPLYSAPESPMLNDKEPLGPLYIQTSHGIFQEAFGDGKRNSLTRDQIDQLTAALALPERFLHKQVSPTTTSSSGFGSTDALAHSASKDASPRPDFSKEKVETSSKKVNSFHYLLLLCIQYVMYCLRKISIQARRPLESTPPNVTEGTVPSEPIKNFMAPSLRSSRNRRVAGVKRKLQFEDEIIEKSEKQSEASRKPYYTELHLGRENQRATTLAAIQADGLQYPVQKLIGRAAETKFITTVFEVRLRGLEEIAGDVRGEIQRWYCEQDDNVIIVCCELQWSTPDRFRNVECESRMKDDVMNCLRINNRRVLNAVADRNEKSTGFNQYLLLPDSVTEEVAGRRPGAMQCWGGSYRRYYDGLIPWGHQEAASEHQPWWEFKKHAMPESIDWPLIASVDKTTFIMVNMICLKLGQL